MVAVLARQKPTVDDLLGWYIWEKLNNVPIMDYEHAANVVDWIEEFKSCNWTTLHERFYRTYHDFVERFLDPDSCDGRY